MVSLSAISGGIDSSLVYMLAKSIKPNDTLGVVMLIKNDRDGFKAY
ncbi:hypothetical protein ONA00_02545 [Mycoplasmopsis cynos]|nr:hypothetical protein [Mycoplasmopsis cynos]WAM11324.1 hypothetical protein ONA00_02545 [Mycoplasmopsis cynos]